MNEKVPDGNFGHIGEKINSMSPKPSESNLRGELRVSDATERGEGLGGGVHLPGQGEFCILNPKKKLFLMHIF